MITIVGAVWSLALWITRQFSTLKSLIYDKFESALIRLEAHERHDNRRFSEVTNQLWELRLYNAGLTGAKGIIPTRTFVEEEVVPEEINK